MPERITEQKSIWVQIKLLDEGFATSSAFDLRWTLEDAVEARNIGILEGGGSGGGWMDFSFTVENMAAVDPAIQQIQQLLTEYHVPETLVRFEVFDGYEQICEETPIFQVGQCLGYRFADGEYGAAIVLRCGNDELRAGSPQVGMPPFSSEKELEILLGLLDYKQPIAPTREVFEQRNWLISTHESRQGQPYLVWLHCYGGVEITLIDQTSLRTDDPQECRFHLSWENVPEYFIRDKYRNNPALNPYERSNDKAKFQVGDCVAYHFADGDWGAALVLQSALDEPNGNAMLVGILDYKHQTLPTIEVFEQRQWLISRQSWRTETPYLVWAIWFQDQIEVNVVGQTTIHSDDPTFSQLILKWESIPALLLHGNPRWQ